MFVEIYTLRVVARKIGVFFEHPLNNWIVGVIKVPLRPA